jgi:drug/metabolite transporter (DMT)-like permease
VNARLFIALLLPPLLWGSNAIVGKVAAGLIPPVTLNLLRWLMALAVLAPFIVRHVFRHRQAVRAEWRSIVAGGFWGITCYNALQYLALTTSSPINTSLIGASAPVFILIVGRLLYGARISARSACGAALSVAGVAWVMLGGNPDGLGAIHFVRGDLYMLAGTCAWSLYTWHLKRHPSRLPTPVLLSAQIAAGLAWSLPIVLAEHAWGGYAPMTVDWRTVAIVAYIGIFPSLVAFFCWQTAVARTSPQQPIFFMNLTPIFTVLLSVALLGVAPQPYHAVGLIMILAGIFLARQDGAPPDQGADGGKAKA